MNNNGISTIIDEFDLDTVLDWMSGEDCQNRDEIKKAEELVCSYRGGKAYRLLETVRTKSYYKNVRVAINRYIPRNDFEISLIDSMKDGIDFLYPDKGGCCRTLYKKIKQKPQLSQAEAFLYP